MRNWFPTICLKEKRDRSLLMYRIVQKTRNRGRILLFSSFTNNHFLPIILWQIRKIKTLFNLKDKNSHRSRMVYFRECSWGESYIGETVRNFELRKAELDSSKHNSEHARHLKNNSAHSFTWNVLVDENSLFKRKIVEGLINQKRPCLNKQVNFLKRKKRIPSWNCLRHKKDRCRRCLYFNNDDVLKSKTFCNFILVLLIL